MRRALALMFALAFVSAALSGCGTAATPSTQSVAPSSATVVLGPGSYSLLPYSSQLAIRQLGGLVFRGLTTVGPDGTPQPDLLAELPTRANNGISADGKIVTLKLAVGAKWQDGAPLTADDVAFTLGLLRSGELTDDPSLRYSDIRSVVVSAPDTLKITLAHPDSPLVWGMVPFVLPKHLLGTGDHVVSNPLWRHPVGSGAYRVTAFVPGKSASLEPLATGAVPLAIVFTADSTEARAAFDAAGAAVWPGAPVPLAGGGRSVVATDGLNWQGWAFRLGSTPLGKDSRLRREMMSLIPQEATSSVPASDPFGLPLAPRSMADTRTVGKALTAQGWVVGKDGIRRKGARKLTMNTAMDTIAVSQSESIDALGAKLQSVGVQFGVTGHEQLGVGGYFDRDFLVTGAYDAARTTVYFGYPLGADWQFASGGVPSWSQPFGGNTSHVRDAALDAAHARVLAAGDPVEAARAWKSLGERFRDLYAVFWEYPDQNITVYKGISGVDTSRFAPALIDSAPQWHLTGAGAAGG